MWNLYNPRCHCYLLTVEGRSNGLVWYALFAYKWQDCFLENERNLNQNWHGQWVGCVSDMTSTTSSALKKKKQKKKNGEFTHLYLYIYHVRSCDWLPTFYLLSSGTHSVEANTTTCSTRIQALRWYSATPSPRATPPRHTPPKPCGTQGSSPSHLLTPKHISSHPFSKHATFSIPYLTTSKVPRHTSSL